MIRNLALLAAVGLLAGCGNKIRGEIEDVEIKPKSAFFFAQPAVLGADSLIGVVMTDLPRGCEDYGFYLASTANLTAPADLATNWGAVFPADFWDITFLMRTGDPNISVEGQVFTGIVWDTPLDAVQKVQGYFNHNLALRDAAYYDGTGDPDLYVNSYLSNGGQMEVTGHEPNASIKGTFATFTVDPLDGRPTGLLEIKFDATFCPEADMLDQAGPALPADG